MLCKTKILTQLLLDELAGVRHRKGRKSLPPKTESLEGDPVNTRRLLLSCGETALVDEDIYPLLSIRKWARVGRLGYPQATIDQQRIWLHHMVVGERKSDLFIDHINGNPLDARRSNLRFCNRTQNSMNSKVYRNNKTGFRGVSFNKKLGKYTAYLKYDGKNHWLGFFDTALDASLVYQKKALEKYPGFSRPL